MKKDKEHCNVPRSVPEDRVRQWPIPSPGELSREAGEGGTLLAGPGGGKLLAGLPGYQLLDSLGVDGAGNVCVATLITLIKS